MRFDVRDRWRLAWRDERMTARRCRFLPVAECAALQIGRLRTIDGTARERLLWWLAAAAEFRQDGDRFLARQRIRWAADLNEAHAGRWLP